jgi:hypothetical protein
LEKICGKTDDTCASEEQNFGGFEFHIGNYTMS